MLRTTSGLSRSVGKWMAQVAASAGATLVAATLYAALPKSVLPEPAPLPELTSGGKFAARAVVPAAYDGLDTMPLPRIVRASVPVEGPETARPAGGDAVAAPIPALASERPAHAARPVRAALRAEPRRAAAAPAAPVSPAASPLPAIEVASAGRADDGIVRKIVPAILPALLSTARDAWSLTASVAGTLTAHVVPQIP